MALHGFAWHSTAAALLSRAEIASQRNGKERGSSYSFATAQQFTESHRKGMALTRKAEFRKGIAPDRSAVAKLFSARAKIALSASQWYSIGGPVWQWQSKARRWRYHA